MTNEQLIAAVEALRPKGDSEFEGGYESALEDVLKLLRAAHEPAAASTDCDHRFFQLVCVECGKPKKDCLAENREAGQ